MDGSHAAGGRPPVTSQSATRPRRRGFHEWPILIVCLGILGGLTYMGMHHFKRGSIVIAAFVCLAAMLRAVLPERVAGMLAVRGRIVDVIALMALGLAIAVVTVFVPPPS
jgi:hypothetical protein